MTSYVNMTIEDIESEIRACKALLNESDYKIIQTLEGFCECTSATGIITFLKSLTTEIKEIIAQRQEYRQTIRDLETELENRTESRATQESNMGE